MIFHQFFQKSKSLTFSNGPAERPPPCGVSFVAMDGGDHRMTEACSPEPRGIMVYLRGIIPFYGLFRWVNYYNFAKIGSKWILDLYRKLWFGWSVAHDCPFYRPSLNCRFQRLPMYICFIFQNISYQTLPIQLNSSCGMLLSNIASHINLFSMEETMEHHYQRSLWFF